MLCHVILNYNSNKQEFVNYRPIWLAGKQEYDFVCDIFFFKDFNSSLTGEHLVTGCRFIQACGRLDSA